MSKVASKNLLDIVAGGHLCFAACIIAELGVADHIPMGQSRSVAELSAACQCNPAFLYRTLRLLASYGIFEESTSGAFSLTPTAESMRSDAPNSMRAGLRMVQRIIKAQQGLEEGMRQGETPFDKAFGQPLFAYLGAHPEDAVIFDAGMVSFHGTESAAMLEAYDLSGVETLADIGGGNGSLISAVLTKYPKLQGLLFDLGHVMGRAQANIQAAGLADRCRIQEGDFFKAVPAGADAYMMRHIIHDWNDDQATTILRNCRQVMPANGRLLIVETVVPPGNERSASKDFDFLMMLYPGGMERTAEEYRKLLGAAGFELHGITATASPVSVIEGRPV